MIVAVVVLPFLSVSIIVDPYSVFHYTDVKITQIESNSNYIKTKYILSEETDFNAFILGSSRAGVLNPLRINSANF